MKLNNDKIAHKISNLVLKMQTKFAAFMSKGAANYSNRSLKVVFIFFCLFFLSLSTWFIIDAFTKKTALSRVVVTHMRFTRLPKENDEVRIILTTTDYNRLQKLRRYMDSLSLNQPGKLVYDSIVKARPGLMDSVTILEKIYLSQQK